MFTKLLKHEWRASRGVLGLICLVCLSAALLGGGSMRYLVWASTQSETMNLPVVLCVLTMVASIIAIVICGVAELFFLIWRFYKSRFTDEGYLTFTLPVTTHQILLSSFVTGILGMVIAMAAVCISLVVLLFLGFSGVEGFWPALWELLPRIMEEIGVILTSPEMKYVVVVLFNGLLALLCQVILLMLSVTIGSVVAQKHKVLAAVGTYYGIQVVTSIIHGITLAVQAFSTGNNVAFFQILRGQTVLTLILGIGGYFLMYFLTDRKLNLT